MFKLTIKTPKRRQWRRLGVFIVKFEHILQWRRLGVFVVNFEHIVHLCSSVFIINFEHVIAGWN